MFENRKYIVHPYFIMISLMLAGMTTLFVAFSGAYLYYRYQNGAPPIALPSLFYWNSLLLIASSIFLQFAKTQYKSDNTQSYKFGLWITLLLTLTFLIMQINAWQQLQSSNVFIDYSGLASFIYLISGAHFLHVIIGIPFLLIFIYQAEINMKSPVSVLVYFSDPSKKRRLKLLIIYWHFLDFLWLYLVMFFFINYMIV